MSNVILASFSLVLVCTSAHGANVESPCRGVNEVFNPCGSNCPPGQNFCTLQCVPKCECANGFFKVEEHSECIPKPSVLLPPDVCGDNEVAMACGVDLICGPNNLLAKPCEPGCYCQMGYVRNSEKKCIPIGNCSEYKCTRGSEYTSCGGCEQRCNEERSACAAVCMSGCFCPYGLFRNADGACVPEEEC